MKIERPSVTITQIPYFDSIEVMLSGILLARDESRQVLPLAYIEEIRDVLNEAIRLKREMDGTPAPLGKAPRVWHENDAEPGPEVTAVIDSDGDIWRRRDGEWHFQEITREWGDLVRNFGPVTEVLP